METRKITVKCNNKEQQKNVIKYARKGKNLYEPPFVKAYIVLFDPDPSYVGTHNNGQWSKTYGHTIISYEEFEKTYLNNDSCVIPGEYYKIVIPDKGYMIAKVESDKGKERDGNYRASGVFIAMINPVFINMFQRDNNFCYKDDKDLRYCRKATNHEIRWLNKCIYLDKFVPEKSVIFETGKWYKTLDYNYFKFNDFADAYSTVETDYISYNGYGFGVIRNDSWWNCENIQELTALTEIQKYLPDGHVDKIMPKKKDKSLKGRWIKALVDYPEGGGVKKGEYGEIISNLAANFPSQSFYLFTYPLHKNGKDIYELMPEGWSPKNEDISDNENDIKEGEPLVWGGFDKVSCDFEPISKEEYGSDIKVGDWVKCIGDSDINNKMYSAGWEKDLVFKVSGVEPFGEYKILWGGKDTNGVYDVKGHVRKCWSHEIPDNEKISPVNKPLVCEGLDKVSCDYELFKPKKGGLLNTTINNNQSVLVNLIKPNKVTLF